MIEVIDDFYECYQEWISQMFPGDIAPGRGSLAANQMIDSAFGFSEPGLGEAAVTQLRDLVPSIPDYYEYFLTRYSYSTLEIPICIFPGTGGGAESFVPLLERGANHSVLPFAYDRYSPGLYCVDLIKGEHVVFFPSDSAEPSGDVLATSFKHVLLFLKELLDWGGDLSLIDESEVDTALRELRSLDPGGLGNSLTWNSWWLPRLTEM